ncbi:cytochrome c biogenesis protein CcdA [Aneurinibacillus sp. Ricciae_BoGa-3]|nr:cytochrome c biogenesis protein CcdA [Aneurinibacillus sp. Ricciae_BoGa-3]WCK54886.1 cytochrome c biogenesis protein CcdA [Aneurinibacillus sp. Ricciae_BoGa-3]
MPSYPTFLSYNTGVSVSDIKNTGLASRKALNHTFFFTLGFSIPFYIMSFFIGKMKWINRYSGLIMKIGGVTMILLSVLLYTNQLSTITRTLIRLYGGFLDSKA